MAKTSDKMSKKQVEQLEKKLALKPRQVWEEASPAQRKKIMELGERYKAFLDAAKTERLAVETIVEAARAQGFKPLGSKGAKGGKGGKFFQVFQNKMVLLGVLGSQPPQEGVRLLGSHIDAPRLDLKMHPLYQNEGLAFLKTHYYGGIKKYHWLARPLALHGVICTSDGRTVALHMGEEPGDPVFTVLDILPHLSRKVQGEKKVNEAFVAERMNLLIAGLPLAGAEGDNAVKLAVLDWLQRQYGVNEADLISAELEVVPAGPARDVGLDRVLVGAYGQDDRVSAFCSLEAMLGLARPQACAVALFADKEEIGSEGSTSAQSRYLEHFLAGLMQAAGKRPDYLEVMQALAASRAISADVNAAFDPDYPEVHEKNNAAFLGRGVNLIKYTGHGGKYGASDANAEYVAWIRGVWDRAGVIWQAAGMGKVDEGGGGTIAKLLAIYGMEIVDAGPALLSMHSPFEIGHKADVYSTAQAFGAFLKA